MINQFNMKKWIFFVLCIYLGCNLFAQQAPPPGLHLVKKDDIKKDLYALAGAHFKGRSAGTLNELQASAWLGEEFRKIGLKPAGDDGTYFQFFTMWRNVLSPSSAIQLNGTPLPLWKEAMVMQPANLQLDDDIVFLGDAASMDTSSLDVAGKVVALVANKKGINLNVSLPKLRYPGYNYVRYGLPLVRRGAKAILFIADSQMESGWDDAVSNYILGRYDITGGPAENSTATVPVIWLRSSAQAQLQAGSGKIAAQLSTMKYPYPSLNIIGKIEGTDPTLKSEYLLYSGHQDALGIRNPMKGDTIYYGADDNASVDVAIMAAARALVKHPPKRSVLVVFHGAEERGLLGSRYFTQHPTVPLNNIVAVLNGDMIGRNNKDSATILGMLPPHRTSQELVNMALEANREGPRFQLDTTWDSPTHIEGWFFRSDHLPYARLGIPSLMYTTLLHPDYHTPQDNAANIDYDKLTRMAEWMYRTGWKVANAAKRPAKDVGFKLER